MPADGRAALRVLLAHIDAEPARLAAAREEQHAVDTRGRHLRPDGRECDYLSMPTICTKCGTHAPLSSTPLADSLRDEREVSDSLRAQLIAAEARIAELKLAFADERDRHDVDGKALMKVEARIAELEAMLKGTCHAQEVVCAAKRLDGIIRLTSAELGEQRHSADKAGAERDTLRAQVEAARKKSLYFLNDTVTSTGRACREILRAIDEARP